MLGESAVLVLGPEDFLADRVVAALVAQARTADPGIERRDVDLGSETALGELVEALSPNLFGDAAVVVCRGAESADETSVGAITSAVAEGLPDGIRLVVVHPGGNKGRGVADRLKKAGLAIAACEKVKGRAIDGFVAGELALNSRRATPQAVAALRTALGDDLRTLASAVSQLASDVEGSDIGVEDVIGYYDGVADMPGYLISDAVWEGRATEAVRRTRWALVNDPGIGPAVTAAVAGGLRQLGRYTAARGGMSEGELASYLGVPPFKVRDVRERVGHWHPAALARAVGELAIADAAVKGRDVRGRVLEESGLDREQGTYLLENTLLRIVERRSRGRS